MNYLDATNVKEFIINRLNQGFNNVDILEEFSEYLDEVVEELLND